MTDDMIDDNFRQWQADCRAVLTRKGMRDLEDDSWPVLYQLGTTTNDVAQGARDFLGLWPFASIDQLIYRATVRRLTPDDAADADND